MSCAIATNRHPKWNVLPVLVIGRIFEHLNHPDRLEASSTCRQWRSVLFQKKFFSTFKFELHLDNERQCHFFRVTMCNLTRELTIHFDLMNVFHIVKIRRILYRVARRDNIQGLRFQTNNVGTVPPGDRNEDNLVDIEHCFLEPLKLLLNRKKAPCRIFDLGSIEALTYYAADFLKAMAKPNDLRELTLASIKFDPSHYPICTLDLHLLQKFSSLQILSLDYDTLNEDVLRAIQVLPLKKFLICVHGLDRQHPGISESAWAEFAVKFKNIELVLTLLYAYEAVEVLQVRILRRHMPLTHFRVLFCDYMNIEALDWMSINYCQTLKSVYWIDSAYKIINKNIMDVFLRSGQDPFVMMSWRCKNLEAIIIHGYIVDIHNIVGISRLRGQSLKRLEVSMVEPPLYTNYISSFVDEIKFLIGQQWEPQDLNDLHPALGYMPVTEEVRDDYVFDLLRRDINGN